MTGDDGALIAAVHRLAAADRRAWARVARLLGIGDIEAQVVVGLAGGGCVTARSLQAEFDLSPGGVAALADRLARERLVRGEPDPERPGHVRLRLSDGARIEVEAALPDLAEELLAIMAALPPAERRALRSLV
jgi:DNA-binding MarR family transcriptional regulator